MKHNCELCQRPWKAPLRPMAFQMKGPHMHSPKGRETEPAGTRQREPRSDEDEAEGELRSCGMSYRHNALGFKKGRGCPQRGRAKPH